MPHVKDGLRRGLNVLPPRLAFHAEVVVGSIPNRWRGEMRRRLERLHEGAGRPEKVMQGPFAGMRLWFQARASPTMACPMMAKLLGTYELELRGVMEAVVASQPDVVVDVGSSDGYYVVGLARRLPRARVIGFETMGTAVHAMWVNHAMNGRPGRVEGRGWCDRGALERALAGAERPFVLCDIDGGEDVLLDPARVRGLERAEILVEVHEPLAEGVSGRLLERFGGGGGRGGTHTIEVIQERARRVGDRPEGCSLGDAEFLDAASEFRGRVAGVWYWMRPRG